MKAYLSVLLYLTLIELCLSRSLWSPDFPEISGVVLEEGRPITLSQPYKEVQICNITGTIYANTLSQLHNVTQLRICRSKIDNVEPGALCSSPNIKTIELDFYGSTHIPALNGDTFKNCANVEEIILKFPKTTSIPATTLEKVVNLKKLYLQHVDLHRLDKNSLKQPKKSLATLALVFCNISEIDPDTFRGLKHLEEIVITHNPRLETLPKELFKRNLKLHKLSLRSNGIKTLSWDEFEGLNKVEELNLAENAIRSFDARKIAKNLPNLKELSIELNPPTCQERKAFVKQLKKKLASVEVTYQFDPGYYDSCEDE